MGAVVVVKIRLPVGEVQFPDVPPVFREDRPRPVAAVPASPDEVAVFAVACGGEEDAIAVRACEPAAINAVHSCPLRRAISVESPPFSFARHTPGSTPVHAGGIVLSAGDVFADIIKQIILL